MAKTLINNGTIISADGCYEGYLIFEGDTIIEVAKGRFDGYFDGTTIDAKGKFIMPGAIDTHVHFREPGLTEKADWKTESEAAVAGGVTTVFDMPNTKPLTISLDDVERKADIAAQKSLA